MCRRVKNRRLQILFLSVFVVVLLKLGLLVDPTAIYSISGDSLWSVNESISIFLVVFLRLFLEGSIGVDLGVVGDAWGVGEVGGAEDVVVFSAEHLNIMRSIIQID